MNYQNSDQLSEKPLNEKLLWFAFFGAIFIYNVVAVIISRSSEFFDGDAGFVGLDSEMLSILFYVFLLFSMVQLVILFKWSSKIEHKPVEVLSENKKDLFMVKYVIADAIAIYGLILFLLSENFSHLILFSGLAIVGMFLSYPKK